MATQKRRVIYLSDQQWTAATERAKAFNISISAYIAKLIEWRQPGPVYIETGERGQDDPEFGHLVATDLRVPARPFAEFRPVPKPGRK